ncbi:MULTISPECIES: cadmium resistance transporter [Pseudomonas]|uniref:Cadmium resistance transporter n=1 Tax=Pseudomonas aphyarum TaxID=2942629 RepID=A0ABT5PQ71_9PSED|nr:cadmium resistance transporter [Pseudomonas aphyarum]MDD0971119.1 cadmium resistance transporter [Pseudomonas aphyarum]MDD1125915.1 cadmium resistance transporter [Pseudomonas aphyarum]
MIVAAALVFSVTNIDDIIILSALNADKNLKQRNIVLGQFIGIGAIILASIIGGKLASSIPTAYIAFLGVVPLGIGIYKGVQYFRALDREPEQAPKINAHSQVLYVSTMTFANGGDNIGVYIPIFSTTPTVVPTYVVVFLIMTAVWCYFGHKLVNDSPASRHIERYGHIVLPCALILIGLHILWGAKDIFVG